MILQLKDTVVVFMAELTAVLADPFHVAVLTRIKAGHLAFLPLVSKTVSIYLNWNALDLDLLTTQGSDLIVQVHELPIYD